VRGRRGFETVSVIVETGRREGRIYRVLEVREGDGFVHMYKGKGRLRCRKWDLTKRFEGEELGRM